MSSTATVAIEALVGLALFAWVSLLTASVRRKRAAVADTQAAPALESLADILRHALRPLLILALTGAAWLARGVYPSGGVWLNGHPRHLRAWVLVWAALLVVDLLEALALRACAVRGKPFPVPDLMRNIVRVVLIAGAVLVVLRLELGIDIAPLLGASALVTAVIGFALQGVLGNLLAGISLHITRAVVPSDWVAIGDVEGEVVQTNWRETRLRTVSGHVMVLPNSTVAAAAIHNMTRPTPLRRHAVHVGASYADAPEEVIAALVEAAREVPDVLRDPEPSAYIVAYLDFGINYCLRFWTQRYHDRTPVEGDVMRLIWYKFKRRGIEIPFPMSDQLLNDFMAVVYNQRRLPPVAEDVARTLADLRGSEFVGQMLVDGQGAPLLGEKDLLDLAALVRRVRYTRGETVFRQGDAGDACYIVVRGRLRGRIEYTDASQAGEFEIGPGKLFGEMSLVTGLPRTATMTATDEAELLEFRRDAFTRLLGLREDIPRVLAQIIAARAAQNAAIWERIKSVGSKVEETVKHEHILQRFLRLLGRG